MAWNAIRFWVLLLTAFIGLSTATGSIAQTLILVRHAEKAAAPADDPPLTPAGIARAQALAGALAGTKIDLVITSSLRRTQDTAAPTIAASHAEKKVVPITATVQPHIAAIVAAVRTKPKDAVILIVGHSDTIPLIAARFGASVPVQLPECAFDRMFVLTLGRTPPSLVVARYGALSPTCG